MGEKKTQPGKSGADLLIVELDERLELSAAIIDRDYEASDDALSCIDASGCVPPGQGIGCGNIVACC